MPSVFSLFGLVCMLGIAFLLSNNRKAIDKRVIIGGLSLQFAFALLILKTPWGNQFFVFTKEFVQSFIDLSDEGAKLVFGPSFTDHFVAFKVLPTIIFVSSLSYVLFHFGILQAIVRGMAWIMFKVMGVSGSESLCAAANVFVGQTEAPLLIKPYLKTMTKSEVMSMMTGGMATVAGGVLAAYVGFGIEAGHLLAASVMSAPAALVIAKVMMPETETSPTRGQVSIVAKSEEVNVFAAACNGAAEGLKLCLNVGAMLIAFTALVAFANHILGIIGGWFDFSITLQEILGTLFSPLAFVMGVPWEEAGKVGTLLGEKTVLNEFVAYIHMGQMIEAGELSERSKTIATYALCGFANFASIAIQIGGIGTLEPSRKKDFARIGFKSMIGGTLAAFMTACIAGALI